MLKPASGRRRIVVIVYNASFNVVGGSSAADICRIIDERPTIGGGAHFEHQFGDNFRVFFVGDVDDIWITIHGPPPGTSGPPTPPPPPPPPPLPPVTPTPPPPF